MIFTAKLVTLVAFVAMTVVLSNGDERERTIRLRRSFGSGMRGAPSSAVSGHGARDPRSASSPEDFVSGLGHSSSLIYGPGLGLSSISSRNESSARERDLATAASSLSSLTGSVRVGVREGVTARAVVPSSGEPTHVVVDRPAEPVPCLQVPVPVDGPAPASLHDAPVQIVDPLQIAQGLRTTADIGHHFRFGLDGPVASTFDYGSSAAVGSPYDVQSVDQQVLYFTAYGSGLQGFDYYNS